ncbi:MAG: hypothetical protein ABH842_05670 [Candidatus Micrarchaeota archaeon]
MKNIYFLLAASFLVFFGCFGPNPPDNLYSYKGVTVAADSIPDQCQNKEDCEMFSCMVSQCWCKSGGVFYLSNITVYDESGAENLVMNYLDSNSITYNQSSIRAVSLDSIFYNVFYDDLSNNEHVLTVAVDGTIMETVCGV